MAKSKGGRPSTYTTAKAKHICALIAQGQTLSQICRADNMPGPYGVYTWLRTKPEFAAMYAQAREARADWRADRIDEIVDGALAGDTDAQAARLAFDAYRWLAGKEKPRVYSDKVLAEIACDVTVSRIERVIVEPAALTAVSSVKQIVDGSEE